MAVALAATGDRDAAATAVIAGYRAVIDHPSAAAPVRIRIARATWSAAVSSVPGHGPGPERPPGVPRMQRTVIELALIHRLPGTEIALVLGLDIRDVRRLAKEGLMAVVRTLPGGGSVAES